MKKRIFCIEPLEARIAPAFAAVIELSSLDGLNGFKLSGVASDDRSGGSVSDAGDVNGDGIDDLIIGAYGADPNGSGSGASYVVFGKAGGFAGNLNLSTLDGSNGFKLSGVAAGNYSGLSVGNAGDVNGDGFGDLIIGAVAADPHGSGSGASYVVFGKADGFAANLNLLSLDGTNGFKLSGVAAGDQSGVSVSAAGDVNGDGLGDLIIGALRANPNGTFSGATYVVFGKTSGFAANLNLSALDGSNGFKLSGVATNDYSGFSATAAGDVNGDGFGDLIIGASRADPHGSNSGASYVVFGKADAFAANLNLSALDGSNGFRLSGVAASDYSGRSVSAAGDVNGDGFGDLVIGAYRADPNGADSGASYVVFGEASGFAANLNLSALDGNNGFKLSGVAPGDYSGFSVSGAGDVNGDGFGDLIIGAVGADPHGSNSGASYVVFGKASGFAANLNLSTLNGSNGFKLNGVALGNTSGFSVSAAGDINDDGFGDLIIGAPGPASGASYVVFGRGVKLSIGDASASEGDTGSTALQFTVSLSEASTMPVSVRYSTHDITALAGSDFTGANDELLTFAPGETSKTITINAVGDTTYELDETFIVALSDASNAIILNQEQPAVGTIRNDDGPPLISIAGGSVLEGESGMSSLAFTVSLSAPSGLPVSVDFASADGTAVAGSDYGALTPGTVNFAPGETTKTIMVDVLGDTNIEDHESFSVLLSAPVGATIDTGTAIGTILNDDTFLRIADAGDVLEGDSGTTHVTFNVELEKPSALPVVVTYAIADGTANAGSDFTAIEPGAQLTFSPGETMKTIVVDVVGDTTVEAHESFSVLLSSASNATIAEGAAMATILNDDALLRIADASVLEGHSGRHALTFTVSLTAPSALPVSVNFASSDGTASAGMDYSALTPGTLNFAPGETSKIINVDVLGDKTVEPSETFSLVLSGATNAVIDDATGVGTILDDDVTLHGKRAATFIDADGEIVTIKVSNGTLKVEDFTIVPSGVGAQLALVDFSGETEFAGANLRITAKAAPGANEGDRLVNVGHINAAGIDLGKVVVKGDLGQIDAGDAVTPQRGLLSLRANSLGHFGLGTQLDGGSSQTDIVGALRTLKLADGVRDAILSISGDIGSVIIHGDVLGGAIRSDGKIGSIKISGDVGPSTTNAAATISARGTLAPTSDAKALAIGAFSIGGTVDHAEILAGYDRTGAAVNADAAIGRIIVRGNWTASDLVAGVNRGGDGMFGTDDDMLISGGNSITAKIASIVIKGTVTGTEGGNDDFGFVAEQIGAFSSDGVRLALESGPSNDLAGVVIGSTGDLRVREAV